MLDADDSLDIKPCPLHIDQKHWAEWLQSGVSPEIVETNVKTIAGSSPYSYLCYSDRIQRTNTGVLTSSVLRKYARTEEGGWWCSSQDPLDGWQPMLWGCFKPDVPRINLNGKVIKYEHPLKTPTRAFFLHLPDRFWLEIATRYGVMAACTATPTSDNYEFWQWVLEHPQIPIILVEGAKKAGCLLSLGFAAIALPGIFNGRRVMRDEFGSAYSESLIPELELFAGNNRQFYFCFDRDTKPQTIANVNLAIAKTGNLLTQKGCDVRVISLLGPEKGVDDFVVARGAAAFESLYQQALTLPSWQWRIKKQAELTVADWLQLNTPELENASIDSVFALPSGEGGIIVLSSGKGTGKTKLISRLVASQDKVIAAGHRIALMRHLCTRMGLDYIGDIDKVNGDFITGSAYTLHLGLCVDSLLSINPEKFAGCVLVIDEFMQVLRHLLTSSTCNKDGKRAALLARLHWLVRAASWVVVADADAADIGIDYLKALRGASTPVYLVRNDYQLPGYPVRFIDAPGDDSIVGELLADLQAGLKVFVATDAKSSSTALMQLAQGIVSPGKLVLINSDTSGDEETVEFINRINERVQQADLVIATPSMATGVSIEVDRFDKVYGLFYGTVTDADASQALSRVRSNVPRVVWCAKSGKNFSPVSRSEYPQQVKKALMSRWEAEICVIRTSLTPDRIPGVESFDWDSNPHLDLWAKLTAQINASMWNLRDNLRERLQAEGHLVEVVRNQKNPQAQADLADARKFVKEEHYRQVASAKFLSPTELSVLETQEFISPTHQKAIEKTKIAQFYCVEDVTPELVAFDNSGKRRQQIMELEALLTGSALSIGRDLEKMERQLQWGQGVLPFDQPCHELRRFALESLGLLPFLVPGKEWTDLDLEPLGSRARSCRHQVQLFLGFKIPEDPTKATNIWIFRRLLQQLGVNTLSQRWGRAQVRRAWIDPETWLDLLSIIENRQRCRESQANHMAASLSNSPPESILADVVTPPYINKSEGVTTEDKTRQNQIPQYVSIGQELANLTAPISDPIATNRKQTTNWTPQQKLQWWLLAPQWFARLVDSVFHYLRENRRKSSLLIAPLSGNG